jgi:hypothetical protein
MTLADIKKDFGYIDHLENRGRGPPVTICLGSSVFFEAVNFQDGAA